jgi:hypothetical protein
VIKYKKICLNYPDRRTPTMITTRVFLMKFRNWTKGVIKTKLLKLEVYVAGIGLVPVRFAIDM